jgi:hypothetical protein
MNKGNFSFLGISCGALHASIIISLCKANWERVRERSLTDRESYGVRENHSNQACEPYAALSIAAYGFLMTQRLKTGREGGGKKNSAQRQAPAVSKDYILSGAAQRAQRHVPNSITTLRLKLSIELASVLGHCPHCNWIRPGLRL